MLVVVKNSQVFLIFVDVEESEDVRMLDQLHDGDLPFDLGQDRLGQLLLVDDLDGNLLALNHVGANFNQP